MQKEIIISLIGFWITCGIATAVIATSKGRSGAWFFVGLLFGPIGILIALGVGKNTKALEELALENGELQKCHFCAESIKVEAKICKHCGNKVQKKTLAKKPSVNQTNSKNYFHLASAIRDGNYTEILRLLEIDTSVVYSCDADKLTLLHIAALENQLDVCKILIQLGASTEVKDNQGETPLSYAMQSGSKQLISLLRT